MPEIDLVNVVKYDPAFPYHYNYDNLPIEGLITRIMLLNSQVDNDANAIRNAIGTAGTLSNRLNQSLEDDGSLKTSAVDATLHSIEEHIDTNDFVRMTIDERSKLSLIEDEATDLSVSVQLISTIVDYPSFDNTFQLGPSPTITWRLDGTQIVADTVIPISQQQLHIYDVEPVTSDNINFTTTSVNTPYTSGTLRIYINGLRITEGGDPIGGFYFNEVDPDTGTFSLNAALSGDIIRIDFNQPIE